MLYLAEGHTKWLGPRDIPSNTIIPVLNTGDAFLRISYHLAPENQCKAISREFYMCPTLHYHAW